MSSVDQAVKGVSLAVDETVQSLNLQVQSRARRAVQIMYNKAQDVLAGQRNGRRYKMPFKNVTYQASAPGEPPAARTGNLRRNWQLDVIGKRKGKGVLVTCRLTSKMDYSVWLDGGSPGGKLKPRPYVEKIRKAAMQEIQQIYSEPLI